MKYIIFEQDHGNNLARRIPLVFCEQLVHVQMAEMFKGHCMTEGMNVRAVSAGFVDQNWDCYGGSETLGLGSRPSDRVVMILPQMVSFGEPTEPEPFKKPARRSPTGRVVPQFNPQPQDWKSQCIR